MNQLSPARPVPEGHLKTKKQQKKKTFWSCSFVRVAFMLGNSIINLKINHYDKNPS